MKYSSTFFHSASVRDSLIISYLANFEYPEMTASILLMLVVDFVRWKVIATLLYDTVKFRVHSSNSGHSVTFLV